MPADISSQITTQYPKTEKPLITYDPDIKVFYHNGYRTQVTLQFNMIKIGCLSITPQAAKVIMDKWNENFKLIDEIVVL